MRLALLGLLLCLLAGCAETEPQAPAAYSLSHGRRITRAEFGDKWPFTVEEGILRRGSDDAITFEADGRVYPVNGRARDNKPYIDPLAILAWNPETMHDDSLTERGRKKGVQPIIDAGFALVPEP